MKKKRVLIGTALCALFAVSCLAVFRFWRGGTWGEGAAPEKREKGLLRYAVALEAPGGSGNGVLWQMGQDTATLLTAAHVAGGLNSGDALTVDGREGITVRGVFPSDIYDLVFLEVEWREEGKDRRRVKTDVESFDALSEGDALYAVGYLGGEPFMREGKILDNWIYMEDFGYHMLWGGMPDVQAGMSGSGVFDRMGRFCGILCGGDGKGEIAVLPLSVILTEWKNIDILEK